MQPTTAMKVHTPSSYLARTSRDSSAGVFGSIAQVNMYRPDPSKGLLTQNPCASRDQRPTRPGSGAPGGASSLRHFAEGRANSPQALSGRRFHPAGRRLRSAPFLLYADEVSPQPDG